MEKYRKEFEIPENLNFYSEENYKIAERKYLKYALGMGGIKDLPESTTSRTAGGLDFTAIGGKRQGREVPQSLKTTRWNRGFSCEAPGLGNPITDLKRLRDKKKEAVFLLKGSSFSDKYNTFKSCASVFLVVAAIAASLLIIRLVGERRLQSFLMMLLAFRSKQQKLDLVSEAFVPDNKI